MRILHRSLLSLPVVCLAMGTLRAADDPFLGKWKVNPSKSKITDEMKVAVVGENKYAIDFGSEVDTVVADGTDQPALRGTTLSLTVEGPNNWKVVFKKDGRKTTQGVWTLSADGKTLDDAFTQYKPDGSPIINVHYTYQRTAGNSGFTGTWDSVNADMDSSLELEIKPYDGDGISIGSLGGTQNIKFDGKDYRRLNQRSLEITDKSQGKITDTRQIEVSADLKTLTMRIRLPGEKEPRNILVFDRE